MIRCSEAGKRSYLFLNPYCLVQNLAHDRCTKLMDYKTDELTASECQADKCEFGNYSAICPVVSILLSMVERSE